jgi:hypothetical protein
MPNFFPEGNTPLPTDSEERSLLKAVSLLETIASGGGGGGGGGSHSGSTFYEIKSANFTAEIGKNYAVDTSSGVVSVTLPTNPQTGEVIGFADAKGTWATNAITIIRNGKNIEGSEINFSNNASGTFFVVLFIDNTTGWRVLTSGTKPLNLTPPTVSGTYEFTSTNGTWTGSPTSYSYQWQLSTNGTSGWANISGATSSTYTGLEADEGKYVRIGVIATNSNGPSTVVYSAASSAIDIPDFPTSGLLAFWKLNDNGSGGLDLTDASGNNRTLTNTNAVSLGTGRIGGAAEWPTPKTARRILTISNAAFALATNNFTISCWFKPSSFSNDDFKTLFTYGNSPRILPIFKPTGYFELILDGSVLTTNATVTFGQWNFLCITRNSGSLVARLNTTDVITTSYNESLGPQISFGVANDVSNSNFLYEGQIDAFGVWNRVLAAEEITQLYNSGNGVEP